MTSKSHPVTREDLLMRRSRLEQSLKSGLRDTEFNRLLREVDAALERMDNGTYGLCDTCHGAIEPEQLSADPLIRFCIDHLPAAQRDALSDDLSLASQIQAGLLPARGVMVPGWETAYHYQAASVVSGDYCDLLVHDGELYFVVGDVTGKGVSAAMLMVHLHATFRALVYQGLPLELILARANRLFCESSLTTHFATLVCGRADGTGQIELGIAGHEPALVLRRNEVQKIGATGLPLGMFCNEQFLTVRTRLDPGDGVLLYTDGLTEVRNLSDEEYGTDRLIDVLRRGRPLESQDLIDTCLADARVFYGGSGWNDDVTVMALRWLSTDR